ncbi:MAG: hypothetical protein KatS3mg068_2401 [Candidatus Sericytochromatia bacterium]|nr:MAG: hypothetical protein KatS3mg068_2401 [Candidatus Sericytochromatia bacterium]
MKKKVIFSIALASMSISQLAFSANAKEIDKIAVEDESEVMFSDVSTSHWAYKAIKELAQEYQILGGFPDGTFRGNKNITRYEAAAMIYQLVKKFDEVAAKSKSGLVGKATLDKLKKEFANELEDIRSELKKLNKDHQDMQQDIDEVRDSVESVKNMLPKVKLMGDASVRYEGLTNQLGLTSDNFLTSVPQARLRLAVKGDMNGGFTFGTRLTTSNAGDITNQFVSLGNSNQRLGLNLDMLYVALRPWDGAFDLTLGRHKNPYRGTTELVWDDDLTLDGAYLKLRFGDMDNHLCLMGGYDVFGINGVNLATNPRSGKVALFKSDETGTAGMASGGAGLHLGNDTVGFMLNANYHTLTNPNNLVGRTLSFNPRTNLLRTDGKGFVSKFDLATGSLALKLFPKAYFPVTLHGDISYNLGAGAGSTADADKSLSDQAKSQNLGFVAGLKLGKLEEAGNFMLAALYKSVGTESVFSAFNEDQLGGTNILAYEAQLGVQLAPSTTLLLTGQLSNKLVGKTDADKDLYTLRSYLMHKF